MCSLHRRSAEIISISFNSQYTAFDPYSELLLQVLPKFLRHSIAGVLDGQVASLRSNLLGRERPLGVPPSRIGPPLLELLHLLLVVLIFRVCDTHVCE